MGHTLRRAGAAVLSGVVVATAAGGMANRAAAAPSSPQVRTVTCPNLGSIEMSLPSGTATSSLPDWVHAGVSYHATNTRTGQQVTGGALPGAVDCGSVAFSNRKVADVTPGPAPAGVATGDRLSGAWSVSLTIDPPPASPPAPTARAPAAAATAPTSPTAAAPAAATPAAAQQDPASFVADLQSYIASRGGAGSAAIFDAERGLSYTAGPQGTFITASIVKVDILATLLRQTQDAGRGLTSSEMSLATNMIEVSDNSAATALWNEVGGGPAVARFNRLVGMPNTTPGSGGLWGLTRTTASDQVQLLKVVAYPNQVLGNSQRGYLHSLMQNVTPSQRWGVSGGVPGGVTIALKNGWLPVSGGWEINSIGHIAGQAKDYLIAVLTAGDPSMGYGITTIQGVSARVWAGLPVGSSDQITQGTWYLRNEVTSGGGDVSLMYGNPGDIPVVGDWGGTGISGPGVVRGQVWYLRNELSSGIADLSFTYGNPGDIPVVGDWNGQGKDGIGVVRNGVWYLRNELSGGNADGSFTFGNPGDVPIVGDWNGDGKVGIGVVRGTTWYLRNDISPGAPDIVLSYGNQGDIPVVGTWNGSGPAGIGVFRAGVWYLRNTLTSGSADIAFSYGNATDIPLSGHWTPIRASRPAVVR